MMLVGILRHISFNIAMVRDLVSDWTLRSVIYSLLHMWYHYVADHNARIVGTKDGARLPQRSLFAHNAPSDRE